jgi:hypothetical protein
LLFDLFIFPSLLPVFPRLSAVFSAKNMPPAKRSAKWQTRRKENSTVQEKVAKYPANIRNNLYNFRAVRTGIEK